MFFFLQLPFILAELISDGISAGTPEAILDASTTIGGIFVALIMAFFKVFLG